MKKDGEMRNNNRQLDEVCLDCGDKIKKQDCNKCPITALKKINNGNQLAHALYTAQKERLK